MNPSAAVVSEFVPGGVLRAGINFGNPVIAQRDPVTGEAGGVGPALARELAQRLGVPVHIVPFETAGAMADAVSHGAWDVAFLAIDPARATDIAFSDAYVHIEGTYLVREDSPLRAIGASFMVIRQAAGVPRDRPAAAAYLSSFIETMKRSGFVTRALRQSGVDDVDVAPPASPPPEPLRG